MSDPHIESQVDNTDVFGFWLYILTDCVLFACLFATFLVLNQPGAFGPSLKEHIELNYVLIETFILLASNFTFGLAMLALYKDDIRTTQLWLIVTAFFGAIFVGMELNEFRELVHVGYSWTTSGSASAFFTLVGTHGLHVSFGLVWIVLMIAQLGIFKTNKVIKKRMAYLGMFWNFLDIVWIFLFSIVYLMGAI